MRRKVRIGCEGSALKGSCDQKILKISSYFPLFGCLRGSSMECEDPGRRSKIFQYLYVTCGLKMVIIYGGYMRSYILVAHRISRHGFFLSDYFLWL